MNYGNRRRKIGMSQYYVAKSIGLPFDKYLEVEKRKRALGNEELNKFLIITEKENNLEYKAYNFNAHRWYMSANFKELLKEFNITKMDLAKELGFSMPQVNVMMRNEDSISDNRKQMLYDYFHNESNKVYVKEVNNSAIENEIKKINQEEIIRYLKEKVEFVNENIEKNNKIINSVNLDVDKITFKTESEEHQLLKENLDMEKQIIMSENECLKKENTCLKTENEQLVNKVEELTKISNYKTTVILRYEKIIDKLIG